jgi:hypothetical protein
VNGGNGVVCNELAWRVVGWIGLDPKYSLIPVLSPRIP